jgi:four helix bundle protein
MTTTHRNLAAWRASMSLVESVYFETRAFPAEEAFGLKAQIRRAAVSIPSNLAEGAARNSRRELLQFLGVSCGSVAELETQLELAFRLGYLDERSESMAMLRQVGKLVRTLRKSVRVSLDR